MARTLVIEQEQERALLIRGLLEDAGHTVTLRSNLNQALSMLQAGDFDVIVLEAAQPAGSMDGIEFVREMGGHNCLAGIGRILIFPQMVSRLEEQQMYGARGFASLEPHSPRTIVVNERNLAAIPAGVRDLAASG